MTLPNFIIIGAGKAGTSALYHWLRQHPEVFMPRSIKETFFFLYEPDDPDHQASAGTARFPVASADGYEALFAPAGDAKAIGEATPLYLEIPGTAKKIKALLPDARLILSLREPVSRVYSHAQMNVRQGRATDAVAEARRMAATGEHVYAPRIEAYLKHYPRGQLCVVLHERLSADPQGTLAEIFRFLGVDPEFRPDTSVLHNPGGLPRSRLAQRLIDIPALRVMRPFAPDAVFKLVAKARNLNARKADLPPDLRAELAPRYRDDILATQALLGLDLSAWLAD